MKNMQIEIGNWLNSDRNYTDGVYLYDRYGNNPQLKRLFPGRENFYTPKLAYELGKLIGIGFEETPGDRMPVEPTAPATGVAQASQDAEEQALRAEQAAEDAEEQASRAEEEANRAEGFAGQMEAAAAVMGAIAAGETVENQDYPPLINRIIAESSRLYNERAILKNQQNGIPDENTPENVAKRKMLIGQIEALSIRLDLLYRAKTAYLESGQMPDEKSLFPSVHPSEAVKTDPATLFQKRNNLRSQVTRAKNMLEYQSQSKGKLPNPMPTCPKRTELEAKIREKEEEIAAIDEKLKNAD